MRRGRGKRYISFSPYIIAIIAVAMVFVTAGFFLVQSIRDYFLNMLETQSINYAILYSHSLTKASEAYRTINTVLENRLISATRTTAWHSDNISDEVLRDLAASLAVDEIYLYSPEGVIIYSTTEAYLGWEAKPGHPVHDFIESGASSLVEEIRPDSESGVLYKYAYVRLDDGRFVQLGVRADIIMSFLESFEAQRLLDEIRGLELVDHAYFVDQDFKVIASYEPQYIGQTIENPEVQEVLAAFETRTRFHPTSHDGGEVYEVYVPIYVDNSYAGTLVVGKSTTETRNLLSRVLYSVVGVGAVVLAGFAYIMISNYHHNQELIYLAYTDALTGLPNKTHLAEVLEETMSRPLENRKTAVLMVHAANMSTINSVYGFEIGDAVLQNLAQSLQRYAPPNCQVFRFAANRFVLLIRDYQDREELSHQCEVLQSKVIPNLDGVGRQLQLNTGILELQGAYPSADDIFTKVAVALEAIESNGSDECCTFYDAEMEAAIRRREVITQEMSDFLARQCPVSKQPVLYLVYQPKVCLESRRIVGFEALARMNSPTYGFVSPGEFIPIAERHNLIIPMGAWVLETACRFMKRLIEEGYHDQHVAVNVSVIELLQDDFEESILRILRTVGIAPHNLQVEITESVFIEDFAAAEARLRRLREHGITIALDDFGSGYSSLSRIEQLPIDCIKIDKGFIDNILVKDQHQLIISEIIAISHKLGLKVVAEGVEHDTQLEYLVANGCNTMQGYLYSKPLDETAALLKLKESHN